MNALLLLAAFVILALSAALYAAVSIIRDQEKWLQERHEQIGRLIGAVHGRTT